MTDEALVNYGFGLIVFAVGLAAAVCSLCFCAALLSYMGAKITGQRWRL